MHPRQLNVYSIHGITAYKSPKKMLYNALEFSIKIMIN